MDRTIGFASTLCGASGAGRKQKEGGRDMGYGEGASTILCLPILYGSNRRLHTLNISILLDPRRREAHCGSANGSFCSPHAHSGTIPLPIIGYFVRNLGKSNHILTAAIDLFKSGNILGKEIKTKSLLQPFAILLPLPSNVIETLTDYY